MKLMEYRVTNYRSINDSGLIDVRQRTALVGRNESGKTNLLLALQSLNPADGIRDLDFVKDFPRDRHPDEFSTGVQALYTKWELTEDERLELSEILPGASDVREVIVTRPYRAHRDVEFLGLSSLVIPYQEAENLVKQVVPSVRGSMSQAEETGRAAVGEALHRLEQTTTSSEDPAEWASEIRLAIETLRQAVEIGGINLTANASEPLDGLMKLVETIESDRAALEAAAQWLEGSLPVFTYLSEYPVIDGHQRIEEYLRRKNEDKETEADVNFGKLSKVAGLDPQLLQELLERGDPEQRNMRANRASAVVTKTLQQLWTDRKLKVRFNLDAEYFDTYVSDPTAEYDVEVNLNERSRGFIWFFSFYVTFAADTMGGPAENAVLLLDEPGLHLHASSQRDLLQHFREGFSNQIVYTTHSPFMIPIHELDTVRTVNVSQEGTTVSNDPKGDEKTLFPLQSALGYDLTQTLFVGDRTLVVEGVTDFWYLSAASEYLREHDRIALPQDLVVTPAAGAQKISYMVALLTAQNLNVLVLLDDEPEAQKAAEHLAKSKLIRDDYIVYVTEGFEAPSKGGADMEDLLGPQVYGSLVEESYAEELPGSVLALNENIPRLVKRYQEAFEALGLEFHKTRPARLFLRKMAEAPSEVMREEVQRRFERVFRAIIERLQRQERREQGAFGVPGKP